MKQYMTKFMKMDFFLNESLKVANATAPLMGESDTSFAARQFWMDSGIPKRIPDD